MKVIEKSEPNVGVVYSGLCEIYEDEKDLLPTSRAGCKGREH